MSKIAVAVAWAVAIANDSSHGYTQDMDGRWGPDYDCSSLLFSAWEQAGVPVKSNHPYPWYTGTLYSYFTAEGFRDVTSSINLSTGEGLQKGDILLNTGEHTEMYIGDGYNVSASSARGNYQSGDQDGTEIWIRTYRNYPWDYVLRYPEGETEPDEPGENEPSETDYPGYVWNYFKKKWNNEFAVAGLMGNLYWESGMLPYRKEGDYSTGYADSWQYTADVNTGTISKDTFVNDSIGYGLAQWSYNVRKKDLYEKWFNGDYGSIGNIRLACDYLNWELNNRSEFAVVLDTLVNCTDVRTASDIVLHKFENPEVQDEAVELQRYNTAMQYYNKYKGTNGNVDDPDTPTPEEKKKGLSLLMMYLATRGY